VCYFQVAIELSETFIYELAVVVSYDCVGDTIATNDVLPNEVLDLVNCYGGQWFCLDPIREVVNGDQKEFDLGACA